MGTAGGVNSSIQTWNCCRCAAQFRSRQEVVKQFHYFCFANGESSSSTVAEKYRSSIQLFCFFAFLLFLSMVVVFFTLYLGHNVRPVDTKYSHRKTQRGRKVFTTCFHDGETSHRRIIFSSVHLHRYRQPQIPPGAARSEDDAGSAQCGTQAAGITPA